MLEKGAKFIYDRKCNPHLLLKKVDYAIAEKSKDLKRTLQPWCAEFINILANKLPNTGFCCTEQGLNAENKETSKKLQDKFVISYLDKADQDTVFMCKKAYLLNAKKNFEQSRGLCHDLQ